MSTNPLVIVRSVAKTYRRRQSKVDALDNVSLEVQNGEFVVLTGRSGSGKTTLLNLIAAPDHPDDGEINVRSTYHPHAARRGSKISQRAHRDRVLVPPFIAAGDRSRERPIAHGSRTDDGPPARDRTTRCSWTGRSKWASAAAMIRNIDGKARRCCEFVRPGISGHRQVDDERAGLIVDILQRTATATSNG